MDYRFKDIYINILPGFNVLLFVLVLLCLCGWNNDLLRLCKSMQGEVAVLTLPFVCLLIGYFVNGTASIFERRYYKKYHRRRKAYEVMIMENVDKDSISNHQEFCSMLHMIKDAIPPDAKYEEYYVHYAQARNMLCSEVLLAVIIGFWITLCWHRICSNGVEKIIFVLLLFHVLYTCLLFKVYHRHYDRYDEYTVKTGLEIISNNTTRNQ